jgi:hypothetical protein
MKNNYFIVLTLALGAFSLNSFGIKPEMVAKQQTEEIKTGFMQLPKDIQMLIIAAISKGNADETFKQIAKLREVNKAFKNLIEDQYSGKYIFETIVSKYPEQKLATVRAALALYTPATIAWLKNQIAQDPAMTEYAKAILMKAAEKNDTELAKHALDFGVDPNMDNYQIPNERGFGSPLCFAVLSNNIELVKYFIKYNADLAAFTCDKLGTPLMRAAFDGNLEIVKLLVEAGAPVNTIDHRRGRTALDLAMQYGHEVVDYLRSKGAKNFDELS